MKFNTSSPVFLIAVWLLLGLLSKIFLSLADNILEKRRKSPDYWWRTDYKGVKFVLIQCLPLFGGIFSLGYGTLAIWDEKGNWHLLFSKKAFKNKVSTGVSVVGSLKSEELSAAQRALNRAGAVKK